MRTNERPDSVLRDEAAAIAADLFPDDPTSDHASILDEAVLRERAEYSEGLRWLAEQTGDPVWHALADAVGTPTIRALDAFNSAWRDAFSRGLWWTLSAETVAALREAARGVQAAEAHSDFELTLKLLSIARMGVHARRRRLVEEGAEGPAVYDKHQAALDRLARLPRWVIGGAQLRDLRPASKRQYVRPPNRDECLVVAAIHDAGPALRASIAADVERLKVLVSEKG